MDFQEGVLVAGRYRLSRLVGAGGMGEVWAGFDEQQHRPIAIKRLLPAAAKHHEVVARFRREAFLLGRVESPHVAKVEDFIDDEAFGLLLIMEFIEGPSLAHVLEDRSFSIEEALDLGVDVAKALVDLHEAKIVHRDLKPGNIILRPAHGDRFQAVIVDFGISRLMPGGSENEVTGITRANIALGTVEYMAPEQILNSRDVTPVTDLYALGIILYRAVKGQHAFGNRRGEELARAKLLEEAPALEPGRDDEIAEGLVRIVARALKKRPAQRYASARDMLAELEQVKALADEVSDLDDTTADGASTLVGRASLPEVQPSTPGAPPRPAAGAPAAPSSAPGAARPSLPSASAAAAPPSREAPAAAAKDPAVAQPQAGAQRPSMPSISEVAVRASMPSISEVPASVGRAASARTTVTEEAGGRGVGRGTVALAVLTAFALGTAFGLVISPSGGPRPAASAAPTASSEPAPLEAPADSARPRAELAAAPPPTAEPSPDDFEIVEVVTAPPAAKPAPSGKMPEGAWVPPKSPATAAPKPSASSSSSTVSAATSTATASAPSPSTSAPSTSTGSAPTASPTAGPTGAPAPTSTGAPAAPTSDSTSPKTSPSPAPAEPAPLPMSAPRPVDTSLWTE